MSLKIRLSRGGVKKRPYYSIIVAEKLSPRNGKFIEKLGTYNPFLKTTDNNKIVININRINHWIFHGAKFTNKIGSFIYQKNFSLKI